MIGAGPGGSGGRHHPGAGRRRHDGVRARRRGRRADPHRGDPGRLPLRHRADLLPLPAGPARDLRQLRRQAGGLCRAEAARPGLPPGVRGERRARGRRRPSPGWPRRSPAWRLPTPLNLPAYLADNRAKLAAFAPTLERPFGRLRDYLALDFLRAFPMLRPFRTVDSDLARYFADPRVRLAFSFQTKYLGMSPFRCPSLFTILSFLEHEHGVYHPIGGCGAVSDGDGAAWPRSWARSSGSARRSSGSTTRAAARWRSRRAGAARRRRRGAQRRLRPRRAAADPGGAPPALARPQARQGAAVLLRPSCSTSGSRARSTRPAAPHDPPGARLPAQHPRDRGRHPARRSPRSTSSTRAPPTSAWRRRATPASTSWCRCPNLRAGIDWRAEAPRYRDLVLDRLELLGLAGPGAPHPLRAGGDAAGLARRVRHRRGRHLQPRPRPRARCSTSGRTTGSARASTWSGGGTHPGSGLPVDLRGRPHHRPGCCWRTSASSRRRRSAPREAAPRAAACEEAARMSSADRRCVGLLLGRAGVAAATLVVRIEGIDAGEGEVRLAVCDRSFDEAGCRRGRDRAPAGRRSRSSCSTTWRPGATRSRAYHDVNGNGELDTVAARACRREPYGFTNDVGRYGRPEFGRALVEVGQGRTTGGGPGGRPVRADAMSEAARGRRGRVRMKVAVIGGGLGGLAAACVLGARGHEVVAVRQEPLVRRQGGGAGGGRLPVRHGPDHPDRCRGCCERIFAEAGWTARATGSTWCRLDPQWRCFFDDGTRIDLQRGRRRHGRRHGRASPRAPAPATATAGSWSSRGTCTTSPSGSSSGSRSRTCSTPST